MSNDNLINLKINMKYGKGRCDLLPLGVVFKFLTECNDTDVDAETRNILHCLYMFQKTQNTDYLYSILDYVSEYMYSNKYTMLLDLSIQFEKKAEKHGIDSWKKEIPKWSYLDSAIRHFLKWLRLDADEKHGREFIWNVFCLIYTIENKGDNDDINNFYCPN